MSNQTQLSTIQFHNQTLITFEQDGQYYTAMKPICENIGLEWGSQYNRIKRDEVLSQGIVIITTPTNSGDQQMLCLPLEYLNGWLFGIDVKRVKPEIRELLITYKKECYKALANYWLKGKAERETLPDEPEIKFLFNEHYGERLASFFDLTERFSLQAQKVATVLQELNSSMVDTLNWFGKDLECLLPELAELRYVCNKAKANREKRDREWLAKRKKITHTQTQTKNGYWVYQTE